MTAVRTHLRPKADFREAMLLAAYRRPGKIAEELREWGYDME
jgi:hypothetical protein